jgi:hypothetical protein
MIKFLVLFLTLATHALAIPTLPQGTLLQASFTQQKYLANLPKPITSKWGKG